MDNLQPILDLLRQVLDVLAVLGGQQHRLDARSERPDQFLLDSPDGRDASAQGNFALCVTNACRVSKSEDLVYSSGFKDAEALNGRKVWA